MACIYKLLDPISRELRYVGKTKLPLPLRLNTHLSEARTKKQSTSHRLAWVRSLMRKGLVPLIEKDCDIPVDVSWADVEVERIAHYRSLGCRLVNGTIGGEGPDEYRPDSRARMSASAKARITPEFLVQCRVMGLKQGRANKGSKRSPEARAKMAAAKLGKKTSAEILMKMSASQKARTDRKPRDQATKDKISAALSGRILSAEHREAISAGGYRRYSEKERLMAMTPGSPTPSPMPPGMPPCHPPNKPTGR